MTNIAMLSRHLNVVTPQRRDVSTSRRKCDFCLNIIKRNGPEIERGSEKRTDEGTESIEVMTQISGEEDCFCIFFFFEKLLIVYRLITCIIKSLCSRFTSRVLLNPITIAWIKIWIFYYSVIYDLLVSALYL